MTSLRVLLPADFQLAYLEEPALRPALAESRAGRVEAAIAAYRRALATAPDLAAAHLGLANELIRWRVVAGGWRIASRPPARDAEAVRAGAASSSTTAFERAGRLERARGGRGGAARRPTSGARARRAPPPRAALALGARAPAHVGLAALARLEGDDQAAARHLAAARAADPSLPAGAAPRAVGRGGLAVAGPSGRAPASPDSRAGRGPLLQ